MANIGQEMDQNNGGTVHSCEVCEKVFNSKNKFIIKKRKFDHFSHYLITNCIHSIASGEGGVALLAFWYLFNCYGGQKSKSMIKYHYS